MTPDPLTLNLLGQAGERASRSDTAVCMLGDQLTR